MFKRISAANFLLFVSVFMLYPVLPAAITDRLDLTLTEVGYIFIFILIGRIFSGPFINYLIDSFRRRSLCITAFILVTIITAAYYAVGNLAEVYILSFAQGVAFGIASSSLITMVIDVTLSENRSHANVVFGWLTRIGMTIGVALGSILYLNCNFYITLLVSVAIGLLGVFSLFCVHIPFRAPIGCKLLSLDRFLLPRSWVLIINLVMIALVPGLLMPLIHFEITSLFILNSWIIPYYAVVPIGFIITFFLVKVFDKSKERVQLLTGLTLLACAISVFMLSHDVVSQLFSALLLGASLTMVTPRFLLMFIDLSRHCERASANTTNLLSWGVGLSAGIALSCYLKDEYSSMTVYQTALFFAAASLIYFILFSYPYYLQKKVR
ncbi:MFS transporter [Bacteroides sp. OttesenSCG-928-D19]|nr:MFS transporter [Bacteroides sp. OttesenSCG-928-D19]